MKRFRIPAVIASLTLLTGCFSSAYRETAYYDLSPETLTRSAAAPAVRVVELRNASGAGSRFQYREKDGRIATDPDHKWIMQPGALVARALRIAMPAAGGGKPARETVRVSGELLVFEVDRRVGKFHLQADLFISSGGREKTVRGEAWSPVKDASPEAAAAAANQAVNELAQQLNKAL